MDNTDGTRELRGAAPARQTLPPLTPRALPTWESFAAEDRARVVRAILHAARRQVESPAGRPLLE